MLKVEVIKRDGRKINFDENKIKDAICKAYIGIKKEMDEEDIYKYTAKIIKSVKSLNVKQISVEEIQDIVEKILIMNKEHELAKNYILYRSKRNEIREANSELMQGYKDITFQDAEQNEAKRENANVDGNTSMGAMLQYGSLGSKNFAIRHLLNEKHAAAHKDGTIHIHDLDFESIGTLTCCQIDIEKLLKGGFSTGHGHLREPQDIMSYAALAAIAIQSNQNDHHGIA